MVTLQKKFGARELHGVYFGAGIKLQLPIKSTYERSLGSVSVLAYYPDDNIIIGGDGHSVELPQHNLGSNDYRFWSGKSQLKTGLAVTGEAGFLFGLSRRVDLRIGVMADYALLNIQKEQKKILNPTGIQQEGSFIADKVDYVGVLNSNQTNNNIRPFSLQGYLGLRIKLGGLKDLEAQNEERYGRRGDYQPDTIYLVSKRDTIIVQFPSDYLAERKSTPKQEDKQARPDFIPAWYVLDPDDDLSDLLSLENIKAKVQANIEKMNGCIYFDLGKYELKTEAIRILDQKVALMKKYPTMKVQLVAHTCDIGDDKLNDQLSKNRAEMTRFYMISQGISPARLQDVPMGKKFPAYPNTDEYRSYNRRVDFRVAN
jgi:outer membrane protein OmpA-like peptidoglycan-associated protein